MQLFRGLYIVCNYPQESHISSLNRQLVDFKPWFAQIWNIQNVDIYANITNIRASKNIGFLGILRNYDFDYDYSSFNFMLLFHFVDLKKSSISKPNKMMFLNMQQNLWLTSTYKFPSFENLVRSFTKNIILQRIKLSVSVII